MSNAKKWVNVFEKKEKICQTTTTTTNFKSQQTLLNKFRIRNARLFRFTKRNERTKQRKNSTETNTQTNETKEDYHRSFRFNASTNCVRACLCVLYCENFVQFKIIFFLFLKNYQHQHQGKNSRIASPRNLNSN